jgi:hypothetical protein
MIPQQVRKEAIDRLRSGRPVREVSNELRIHASTLHSWQYKFGLREPRARKLQTKSLEPQPDDLSFTRASVEARCCLRIAIRNGGIEKMRRLIAVSEEEKRELQNMYSTGELSPFLVLKSLHYRVDVLREFDKLVSVTAAGESSTAAEINHAEQIAAV